MFFPFRQLLHPNLGPAHASHSGICSINTAAGPRERINFWIKKKRRWAQNYIWVPPSSPVWNMECTRKLQMIMSLSLQIIHWKRCPELVAQTHQDSEQKNRNVKMSRIEKSIWKRKSTWLEFVNIVGNELVEDDRFAQGEFDPNIIGHSEPAALLVPIPHFGAVLRTACQKVQAQHFRDCVHIEADCGKSTTLFSASLRKFSRSIDALSDLWWSCSIEISSSSSLSTCLSTSFVVAPLMTASSPLTSFESSRFSFSSHSSIESRKTSSRMHGALELLFE